MLIRDRLLSCNLSPYMRAPTLDKLSNVKDTAALCSCPQQQQGQGPTLLADCVLELENLLGPRRIERQQLWTGPGTGGPVVCGCIQEIQDLALLWRHAHLCDQQCGL